MAETWTIDEETAEELDLPHGPLLDWEIFDKSRWGVWKRGWFEHEGKFWQIKWEEPSGDGDPGAYENFPQTARRVEKREVVVEKWVVI